MPSSITRGMMGIALRQRQLVWDESAPLPALDLPEQEHRTKC